MTPPSNTTRIRHILVFNLKPSVSEKDFLNATKTLETIPGVEKFEFSRQVNKKINFEYGLTMEFASQQVLDQYFQHPVHVAYIQQHWQTEVAESLIIDLL